MFALLPLMLALQTAPQPDSAAAIQQARDLVGGMYVRIAGPGDTRPCRGITFDDCRQGSWNCPVNICLATLPALRADVLDRLDELAPRAGNSEWVYRQRVALAVKHGDLERARPIALECSAAEWWCMTLRGFVAHKIQPGAGLPEFEAAFALGGSRMRCEWMDFTPVRPDLDTPTHRSCQEGEGARQLFWWLADPSWSQPGNKRLSEHFSRWVMYQATADLYDAFQPIAPGQYWTWEPTLRPSNLVLPLGFVNSIGVQARTYRVQVNDTLWREYHTERSPRGYVYGGYSFAPDSARFVDPVRSAAADWEVRWDDGDERLITRDRWHNLEHQTAVFRRGDRLLVVAAAVLPAELSDPDGAEAFLVLGRPADLETVVVPAERGGEAAVRASTQVARGGYVVSIEVVRPGLVGRARHGAPEPPLRGAFGISDLALVAPDFEEREGALHDALLPSVRLPRTGQVGLYFEIYGIEADERVKVELFGEGASRSLAGRLLSLVRRGTDDPIRLTWEEPVAGHEGIASRFFLLDLASLPSGTRQLTLTLTRADGTALTAVRAIDNR